MAETPRKITPKLDNAPPSKFKDDLGKEIDSHRIFEEGWEIRLRRYEIPRPVVGNFIHTNLELRGPPPTDSAGKPIAGAKGFYVSLDTNTYTGINTGTWAALLHKVFPYATGTEIRITTDMERNGNWVVKDENLIQDVLVAKGTGTDMLLLFTQMGEQAKEFNSSGAEYALFSDDADGKERANSNAPPLGILKELGYDIKNMNGVDLTATTIVTEKTKQAKIFNYTAPGADDDISSLFPDKKPGYFQSFKGNSAALVTNPDVKAKVVDLFTNLHPDCIGLNDPEIKPANKPPTPCG